MDFLPIRINNKKVYAGFWLRLGAGIVDAFVLISIGWALYYFQGINFTLTILFAILISFIFVFYHVYFNKRFGGSLGKLAVNIRVTKPNGHEIGWKEAWLRSSVDCALAVVLLILELIALSKVDQQAYLAVDFISRYELILPLYPSGYKYYELTSDIWLWGELLVLLFNERKRAIHDFIAGTVVIHKDFAEPVAAMGLADTSFVLK